MKLKSYLLVAVSVLAFVGCKKDYLDVVGGGELKPIALIKSNILSPTRDANSFGWWRMVGCSDGTGCGRRGGWIRPRFLYMCLV